MRARSLLVFLLVVVAGSPALLLVWRTLEAGGHLVGLPIRAPSIEGVKAYIQFVAGAFLLIGAYLTWRRVVVADKTLAATERTLAANVEGQITERFSRAVDQLGASREDGSPNIELRLGGIYSLERIARDSVRDRWTIVEILMAYVRSNARRERGKDEKPVLESRPDVAAALTAIARRVVEGESEENRVVLQECDLRNARLWRANLERAYLDGSDLAGARLGEARLRGALFTGAVLSNATLVRADLRRSNLDGADLTNAVLGEANLSGASLGIATLVGAELIGADLRAADLRGADLSSAAIILANFDGADLRGADLSDAGPVFPSRRQFERAVIDENTRLPTFQEEYEDMVAQAISGESPSRPKSGSK